ncbi:MAG: peptidoglycan-binding protein [Pseudomonadota bacterium]
MNATRQKLALAAGVAAMALGAGSAITAAQAQEVTQLNNVTVVTHGAVLGRPAPVRAAPAALVARGLPQAVRSGQSLRTTNAGARTAIYTNSAIAGPSGGARFAPTTVNASTTGTAAPISAVVTTTAVAQQQQLSAEDIERLRRENAALRQRNEQLTRASTGGSSGNAADLPPNAKSGECYARVIIPGQYETSTERVLDTASSERVEVIPAEYAFENQQVLTREASERIEVIPATYKTVSETVEVEPARTELKTIPATYENVTEQILVREAYTTWKKGSGPITRVDSSTGEIMCLVEVPAEYKTVVRKELKSPARTEEVFVPAKTRTITKRVLDQPATTRSVPIPAQYDTVRVRKLVRPAQERRIPIEATYRTLTKQRKVSDERLEWREILCETNTTPGVIRKVQIALRRAGYNPGGVDGVLGAQTISALRAYQVDQGLPSGQLTMATIRRLGVI